MAGPWERYKQPSREPANVDGPWARFKSEQQGAPAGFLDVNELGSATREIMDAGNDFVTATSDTIKPGIARATGSVINALGEPVEKWTGMMGATQDLVLGRGNSGFSRASGAIAGETEQARDVIRTADTDIRDVVGRYEDGSAGYYGALTGATAPATVAGVSVGLASRNPTVGMAAFSLPAYSDAYSQARMEEGASIPEAMGYGAMQAGAEVVTELPMLRVFRGLNVPGMNRIADRISGTLGRASRAVNSSAVGRTGVAVASEAGSEAASQFLGSGIDVGMGYEEADLDQMLTGMRDAAVLGGVMGGALYGATKPIRMTDEVRQLRARERVDQIRTELRSLQGQEAADYLAKTMESADPYTQGLLANSITETDLATTGLMPPPAQQATAGAPPAPAATQSQAPAQTPASDSLAAPLMDELAATNQQTELDLEGQILQQSQVNAAAQQQAAAQQAEMDQYAAEDAAEAEQLTQRGLRFVGREERGRSEPVVTPYSEAVPQREEDEEDSAYAYRAIKDLPIPESLPEDLPRMFHMSKADAVVDLSKLRPLAGKEARSSDNSSRFMALAREGKLEARDPVDVRVEEDGTYTVLDGNGTFAAAKKYGWSSIPIRIKEAPAGQEGFRISRGTLTRPAGNKLVKKYEAAQQAKPAFDSLVNSLASTFGGKFKGADLKGRTRAEEKIKLDYAKDGVSEVDAVDMLNDLVRGTLEFDTVEDARRALDQIGQRLKVVKKKDGISEGTKPRFNTGYRDANLIVEMENGTRAEIQISVTPLLEAKKAGHKLYDEFRPLDSKINNGEKLTEQEQDTYDRLLKAQQDIYLPAWEKAQRGKTPDSSTSRSNNSEGRGTSSTRVDAPTLSGAQSGDIAQDLPSSNAMTERSGSRATSEMSDVTQNTVPSGSERGSADLGSTATGESSSADGQSVAPAVKPELTDGEIRAFVEGVSKALPGVKFEVVESFDAIPVEAREDMDGEGVVAIFGADGKIYVIGPEVASRDDLTESLKHEVGHAGLRVLLGKKYAETMRKVYTYAAANPNSVAGQWLKKIRQQYPGLSTVGLGDEVVAHMAEVYGQLVPAERGILQRIADSVRGLMQKAGLVKEISDAEIYRMIVAGRRALAQERADGQEQREPRASRKAAPIRNGRSAQGRTGKGDGQPRVSRRDGEAGQPADQADADASAPEWNDRPVQPDAVTLDAIHWSNTDGLTELDPKKYGTNHKGGEWKRVMGLKPSDPRRQRLSIYIKGTPFESRPESMIAREARYGVRLTNMYPMDTDPRDFRGKFASIQSDTAFWNAVEKAVVDGGFDGWFSANTWGVVLGTKPVRVARARKRDSSAFDPKVAATSDGTLDTASIPAGNASQPGELPTSLRLAFEMANRSKFRKNRDLKLALQQASLAAQQASGVNLREISQASFKVLSDAIVADAIYAMQSSANAVGWYDKTVAKALAIEALMHPEIVTDPESQLAMKWAIAVTSNGLKVDKNFELADVAYQSWKATGKFPTDIGIGQAKGAINEGLAMFNELSERMTLAQLEKVISTKFTVAELEQSIGKSAGGEWKGTSVRGAAILGPKIGNGFLSNLNGYFDALTIDRWFMRTWGRLTGELVILDEGMIADARRGLAVELNKLGTKKKQDFAQLIGAEIPAKMTNEAADAIAVAINKFSMKPENRDAMAEMGADSVRKAGNKLQKALDGQKEAPSGPAERNWIRTVMADAISRLGQQYPELTMSDLQALLWYPEKRLYDMAKSEEDAASEGYDDDEAPDYANAAAAVARARGFTDQQIADAAARGEAQGSRRGAAFTDTEKAEFLRTVVAPPEQADAVVFEVAPNPDDAELTELWNKLADRQKETFTRTTGRQLASEIAEILGIKLPKTFNPATGLGGFEGQINPNLTAEYSHKAMSLQQATQFASALGYVLDQKAMVLADSRLDDDSQVETIMVTASKPIAKYASQVFDAIRRAEPSIDGFSVRGKQLSVLNFSGKPMRDVESKIAEQLEILAGGIDADLMVSSNVVKSRLIEAGEYGQVLGLEAQRPGRRGVLGAGQLDGLRDRARAAIRDLVGGGQAGTGRVGAGDARPADGGADGEAEGLTPAAEPRARRLPTVTPEQRQMLAARELRLPVEIGGEVQQLSGNALKIIERARQRVENLERLSACLAS